MTYKEIVDRIKDIADRHKMIADFGYGNLSDIKANNDGNESADYPYAFLNPTNHTRSGQAITYRFNLIVMDMVLDNDYLKIQSECQQYIDDLLGNLRFGYTDQVDLTLNVTLTPFKERFQDVVAGMTATLEIVIPNRLSDCYNVVPSFEKVVEVYNDFFYTRDPDTSGNNPLQFNVDVLNDGNWQNTNFYRLHSDITATYKFEWTQQVKFDVPVGTEIIPEAPILYENRSLVERQPTSLSGWPSVVTDPNEVYNISATWEFTPVDSGSFNDELGLVILYDDPAVEEVRVTFLENGVLKIYKQI